MFLKYYLTVHRLRSRIKFPKVAVLAWNVCTEPCKCISMVRNRSGTARESSESHFPRIGSSEPCICVCQALPAAGRGWQGLAGNYGRIVECGSRDHLPRWYDAPGVISTLLQLGGWCSKWPNTQLVVGCPCQHPCQQLAGAGRQLRFYIDPERSQNMPEAKKNLGSSPDAVDMYAAQFLA